MNKQKYVIISTVRNEEKYIEKTMQSIISQTILPVEWIIVNDGSTDKTEEIIRGNLEKNNWIKCINLQDRGYYLPGPGIVKAFYCGFDKISCNDWEFLVKLDCDLSFDKNYFEEIFTKFQKNEKLGIASGCTFLPQNNLYIREKVQEDHPVGPCKTYRRKCFEDIGGLKYIFGWDLIDNLSAQMKGWETRAYNEYQIIHFRQTGSQRKGITKGNFFTGTVHYKLGYLFIYTVLSGVYKTIKKPFVIGGLGYICGYICAMIKGENKYLDNKTIAYLRKKQAKHLIEKVRFWKCK